MIMTSKPILCADCEDIPPREAEFFIVFTDYWRMDYHLPKKYPLCSSCLMDVLGDRYMGGGGYTSGDILKIFINRQNSNIKEIDAIDPKVQRGYHYRWEYFVMKIHHIFNMRRHKKHLNTHLPKA